MGHHGLGREDDGPAGPEQPPHDVAVLRGGEPRTGAERIVEAADLLERSASARHVGAVTDTCRGLARTDHARLVRDGRRQRLTPSVAAAYLAERGADAVVGKRPLDVR